MRSNVRALRMNPLIRIQPERSRTWAPLTLSEWMPDLPLSSLCQGFAIPDLVVVIAVCYHG
jgi:hypothetical protein